jgi:hypothetical protein
MVRGGYDSFRDGAVCDDWFDFRLRDRGSCSEDEGNDVGSGSRASSHCASFQSQSPNQGLVNSMITKKQISSGSLQLSQSLGHPDTGRSVGPIKPHRPYSPVPQTLSARVTHTPSLNQRNAMPNICVVGPPRGPGFTYPYQVAVLDGMLH